MTIKRHEPSKIYSTAVEANGFVFLAGIVTVYGWQYLVADVD